MGSVVLLSGGIDSTTCAALEAESGRLDACVFVNYGQPSAWEEQAAADGWCAIHNVRLFVCSLPLELGAMSAPAGVPGARVVPARNLALAAMAVSVALTIKAKCVVIGATASDHGDYKDCRLPFVRALSALCRDTYDVQLEAPFINSTKGEVLLHACRLNVDIPSTWSCYAPVGLATPCGNCDACKARASALASGGEP